MNYEYAHRCKPAYKPVRGAPLPRDNWHGREKAPVTGPRRVLHRRLVGARWPCARFVRAREHAPKRSSPLPGSANFASVSFTFGEFSSLEEWKEYNSLRLSFCPLKKEEEQKSKETSGQGLRLGGKVFRFLVPLFVAGKELRASSVLLRSQVSAPDELGARSARANQGWSFRMLLMRCSIFYLFLLLPLSSWMQKLPTRDEELFQMQIQDKTFFHDSSVLPDGAEISSYLFRGTPKRFFFVVEEDNTPFAVTVTPCDTPLEWKLSLQDLPEESSGEDSGDSEPLEQQNQQLISEEGTELFSYRGNDVEYFVSSASPSGVYQNAGSYILANYIGGGEEMDGSLFVFSTG
ncbi:protein NDNF [Crotalus adamanteus]|uniref:Protein NDNF n=1 Tax=Crotalus adamanteus TaxID=8729 RepID=A0AAW1BA23_CROAD